MPVAGPSPLLSDLRSIVGHEGVLDSRPMLLADATEGAAPHPRADAVVAPPTAEAVAEVVRWCYAHDMPLIVRGGGSGLAGGAVPVNGGVVVSLECLSAIPVFDPLLWRMHVEAGVTTERVRRLARENGLYYPPDPGAAEQSHIGGNLATNAGGPHAFKYGVTSRWVTGLEAVVPPGEVVRVGGSLRKDVAGYDLRSLLLGSEGTLGIITSAWLRLIPAPEAFLPAAFFFDGIDAGCAAVETLLGSGLDLSAVEVLDGPSLACAAAAFPGTAPPGAGFLLITEADGSEAHARAVLADAQDALAGDALAMYEPAGPREVAGLWRWRDGVSLAAASIHGGKLSEDIAVPLDRLAEAMHETHAIGRRHGLDAMCFGHAGDGNLHSTFLYTPGDPNQLERVEEASHELFAYAASIGGSISGEHGLGLLKSGHLHRQWDSRALDLHDGIKRLFDPKGLLNPGKKLSRASVA